MTCEVPTLKRSLTQVSAASDEHCNQPQKTAGSCMLFSCTQDLSESQEKFITDLVLALVATCNSDALKDLMFRDFHLWNPTQTSLHRTP